MDKGKLVIRWIARIWSLGPIYFGLAHLFFPDSVSSDVIVPWTDWLALSLAAVCLVGLAVAWRWEKIGGWIAVGALIGLILVFVFTVERIFPTLIILLIGLGTPAVLFLIAGGDRHSVLE